MNVWGLIQDEVITRRGMRMKPRPAGGVPAPSSGLTSGLAGVKLDVPPKVEPVPSVAPAPLQAIKQESATKKVSLKRALPDTVLIPASGNTVLAPTTVGPQGSPARGRGVGSAASPVGPIAPSVTAASVASATCTHVWFCAEKLVVWFVPGYPLGLLCACAQPLVLLGPP